MTRKNWVAEALDWLADSLEPVPHEINELDWKVAITDHKDRLIEHLIAFANYPNGGCLVFGVDDTGKPVGISQSEVATIANTLANVGRDAIEPPLALDHSVADCRGTPILLVRIREPGKKLDRLIGTTPESRNDKLASSFRRYRICEERGTGFQKAVKAIELFGLPPLKMTVLDNAFRVTLFAPKKFSDMTLGERVEATYQHAVLQYLSSASLTNTSLRNRFKLHEKSRNQITNLIGESVAAGRLKRKDEGSGNKFAEYWPYWA